MQCEDGGTYAGELLNGLRHGRGKQVFANGQMFTGCFQHDRRCGIWRLDLANDGGFYLGEWKVRVEGWVCATGHGPSRAPCRQREAVGERLQGWGGRASGERQALLAHALLCVA